MVRVVTYVFDYNIDYVKRKVGDLCVISLHDKMGKE